MKRAALILFFASLVLAQAVRADVRFARFKFQPDKTYNIEIFHKNIIKFQFKDPQSSDGVPPERVIPMENQALFNATIRTYPVTEKNIVPVKMYLTKFVTLIKRGKEMVPQDTPEQNELKDKEFLGELDASGAITLVRGRSHSDAVPAGDASVFQLLDMIPDLPEGEHAVGSVFYMNDTGRFFLPEREKGRIAVTYTVSELNGDEVHVVIRDGSAQQLDSSDDPNKPRLGTSGDLVYSQSRKVCTSVRFSAVSASEPEKEDLREKGVVVNNHSFAIKIDEVK
jgi:hypothetical protein